MVYTSLPLAMDFPWPSVSFPAPAVDRLFFQDMNGLPHKLSMTLTSSVTWLLRRRAAGEALSPSELRKVKALFGWRPFDGKCLPTVHHVCGWLGWGTAAAEALEAHNECLGTIILPPARGVSRQGPLEPCRLRVWCPSCASLVQVLGQGWNLPRHANAWAALLAEHSASLHLQDSGYQFRYSQPPHKCGPNCPYLRTAL